MAIYIVILAAFPVFVEYVHAVCVFLTLALCSVAHKLDSNLISPPFTNKCCSLLTVLQTLFLKL